jgi:hypothetical protein
MAELCGDCGVDTTPQPPREGTWEWYVVWDGVWQAAGMPVNDEAEFSGEGVLCVGCLEHRLGRRLRAADFTAAPVNWPGSALHTPRLRSRLTPLAVEL